MYTDTDQIVQIDIKYINSAGSVIDSTKTEPITIKADEERIIRGHSLISVPAARDVKDAKLNLHQFTPP